MTPVAAARAGRLREIVVGARSRGEGTVGSLAYRALTSPAVVGTAVALALILREPTLLTRPEFVFEDGRIFYIGALADGLSSIVTPYAGYLHVAARLLAFPETWVPVAVAPLAGSVIAIATTALVAIYVQRLPVPLAYRLGLAAIIALLPGVRAVAGYVFEVQWYLAIALVAAAFIRPRWWDHVLIAVTSLTGPFSILLAPLYLVVARDRRALIVLAGALIQFVLLASSTRYPSEGDASPLTVLQVLAYRGIAMRIMGGRLVPPSIPEVVAVAAICAALVLALVAGWRDRVATAFGYAALAIALAGAVFGATRGEFMLTGLAGERYFVMASVALGAAALAGLVSHQRGRVVAGGLLVGLLVVGMVRDFHVDAWPAQGWAQTAPACIGSPERCDVPVFPPEGWSIHWPGKR